MIKKFIDENSPDVQVISFESYITDLIEFGVISESEWKRFIIKDDE